MYGRRLDIRDQGESLHVLVSRLCLTPVLATRTARAAGLSGGVPHLPPRSRGGAKRLKFGWHRSFDSTSVSYLP
ncbi:hypothetical protein E2C01_085792 [Portunus trituberculatus]|uniref:Uncharacterized protein n=1 Tax=Portunus trituberculatus TaxID=210409 RepID=A0A5B7J1Y4_PORTR|nr:hypothetical protein [Portunus trituberculatus]